MFPVLYKSRRLRCFGDCQIDCNAQTTTLDITRAILADQADQGDALYSHINWEIIHIIGFWRVRIL